MRPIRSRFQVLDATGVAALLFDDEAREIHRTIRRVVRQGERVFQLGGRRIETPEGSEDFVLLVTIREAFAPPAADPPGSTDLSDRFGLTPREREVALLLARRLTNREVAACLGVSVHTARRHTERVLSRLGVHSRRHVRRMLWGGSKGP